jgi:RNA polymerase sigma-70 factor (ECF subfamily)
MEGGISNRSSGATPDEAAMLARMQAGDEEAFEACTRAHCGQLLLVARRLLRNQEDARDAVQEAFLSAFKDIGRFKGRSRLSTWLQSIVVNAALCQLRSRQRHPEQSIEDLLPQLGEDERQVDPPAPWQDTSEMILQEKETCELVRGCIEQLPEIYRTVLVLRDIKELDTEETARMLGTSQGVVKTRLHRAHQALRSVLAPHFRRDEP